MTYLKVILHGNKKNGRDVMETLNAGEQKMRRLLYDLKKLESGTICKIIAPFIPAPLIDKATRLGMDHWIADNDMELFSYI